MNPHILVAGVGNLFHGDDAFGSEVARRLALVPLPAEVRVADFGIRGYDLACALQDGYQHVVLVDVIQRGGLPGTLYVIELDLAQFPSTPAQAPLGTHTLDPYRILCQTKATGMPLPRMWLVGCEPGSFGPEEGLIGLSEPVEAALPEGIRLIQALVDKCLRRQ